MKPLWHLLSTVHCRYNKHSNYFLFSYAGLHCVVIKGYSKSAGYQPGVKFEDNRFRNSWNAVYVAGAWRFVQCNWGARHLVNAKEVPKPGKAKSDSLRCGLISIHSHSMHNINVF